MFKRIAVPVDLGHTDKQARALAVAADLARHYSATVVLVAVTTTAPSATAHNPEEFAARLADYAAEQSQTLGVALETASVASVDISIDLEKQLDGLLHEQGADLVVMASHVPGFRDYVFHSRAGKLASHTDLSVMIVR